MKHLIRAFDKMKQRNWDCIYIAVDVHGTMIQSSYKMDNEFNYYPGVVETLQQLSSRDDIKLILYTSSHESYIDCLFSDLVEKHIYFDYVNENPEVDSNSISNYEKKFHFDVLLDDKAGFDPETDWAELINVLNIINKNGTD